MTSIPQYPPTPQGETKTSKRRLTPGQLDALRMVGRNGRYRGNLYYSVNRRLEALERRGYVTCSARYWQWTDAGRAALEGNDGR